MNSAVKYTATLAFALGMVALTGKPAWAVILLAAVVLFYL